MKYMGSKNRIAKSIVPILLDDLKDDMIFIDTCVGGANIIDKIPTNIKRYGNDNNKYLIALYNGIKTRKDFPTAISKELYDKVRVEYNNGTNITFDDFTIGWVGYMASANGRFFEGGYSGISETKVGTSRNYIDESIRGFLKQLPDLDGITFTNKNILDIKPKVKSLLYCDIPYKDTKQYATSKDFNYKLFYQWCRDRKEDGHVVFISEYSMPNDFKCVWTQEVKSSLSANGVSGGSKVSVEKLFTL